MNTSSIKHDFFSWIITLEQATLSDIDKKMLNLLINNIDNIIPLGTARGARAKKIGQLIEKNCGGLSSELPNFNIKNTSDFEKPSSISELIIGPFRGFTTEETFIFDKKYTFMYGPNGSGKSSFCEGLEYALLGKIEEAESKRIDVQQYTKNVIVGDSKMPIVFGLNADNQKFIIKQNLTAYRFCFIEKNRIDGFARIAANTTKAQQDRIATLFGLDAFNEFVSGFTGNLDERHITLVNNKEIDFNLENQKIIAANTRISVIDRTLQDLSVETVELLNEVGQESINSLENLKIYLVGEDGTKGKISELHELRASKIPIKMDETVFGIHKDTVGVLRTSLTTFAKKTRELEKSSSEVNYKELYTAIKNISKNSDTDNSICPACKTSLEKVVINPFNNAISELAKMGRLAELQDEIEESKSFIQGKIRDANKNIETLNLYKNTLNDKDSPFEQVTNYLITPNRELDKWIASFSVVLVKLEDMIESNINLQSKIHDYNLSLDMIRERKELIDQELLSNQKLKQRFEEINAKITAFTIEKSNLNKQIEEFSAQNDKKLKEIAELNNKIVVHKEFVNSYQIVVEMLKSYTHSLPSKLAVGLSEKAKEFYNIINNHDQDFERLEYLKLPATAGEKINIRFYGDKNEHDALLILSEGHIKILGLAILLSKVVNDNLNFVIYDDIVNAIDDDHRDGISELLMNNILMKDRQHIITCHGEIFISKLEHKLGASVASKEVKSYRFVPSDAIEERGVKISIGSSKHYILLAKKSLLEDSRKDAASRCRQAIESISEQLWSKLYKKLNVKLTVIIRCPGMRPDLSTVVDGLIKELKSISNADALYEELKLLKERYTWSILNKGTHEQGDLPEFERKDITDLIALVESIERKTKELEIDITSGLKLVDNSKQISGEVSSASRK